MSGDAHRLWHWGMLFAMRIDVSGLVYAKFLQQSRLFSSLGVWLFCIPRTLHKIFDWNSIFYSRNWWFYFLHNLWIWSHKFVFFEWVEIWNLHITVRFRYSFSQFLCHDHVGTFQTRVFLRHSIITNFKAIHLKFRLMISNCIILN